MGFVLLLGDDAPFTAVFEISGAFFFGFSCAAVEAGEAALGLGSGVFFFGAAFGLTAVFDGAAFVFGTADVEDEVEDVAEDELESLAGTTFFEGKADAAFFLGTGFGAALRLGGLLLALLKARTFLIGGLLDVDEDAGRLETRFLRGEGLTRRVCLGFALETDFRRRSERLADRRETRRRA